MPKTFDSIASVTLTSTATVINFTNIPQTFTDLVLVANVTGISNTNDFSMRVGNTSIDTGSNYSSNYMRGNGSTGGAGASQNSTYIILNSGDSTPTNDNAMFVSNFMGYTNANDKQVVTRWGQAATSAGLITSQWRGGSSPIKLIQIFLNTAQTYTFSAGSKFSLYGIKAA